jgi:hypothetical protein
MLLVREIFGPLLVWKEKGNVVIEKGGSPELIGNRDRLGFKLLAIPNTALAIFYLLYSFSSS